QTASELYGRDLRNLLDGPQVTADQREYARAVVADAEEVLDRALSDVDVVMCATVPIIAPQIGHMEIGLGAGRCPFDFLLTVLLSIPRAMGGPAMSVPAPTESPLPVGAQFLARRDRFPELMAAASAVIERDQINGPTSASPNRQEPEP